MEWNDSAILRVNKDMLVPVTFERSITLVKMQVLSVCSRLRKKHYRKKENHCLPFLKKKKALFGVTIARKVITRRKTISESLFSEFPSDET